MILRWQPLLWRKVESGNSRHWILSVIMKNDYNYDYDDRDYVDDGGGDDLERAGSPDLQEVESSGIAPDCLTAC